MPDGLTCLRVELEITNVAEGEEVSLIDDEDFSVVDGLNVVQETDHSFGKIRMRWRNSIPVKPPC